MTYCMAKCCHVAFENNPALEKPAMHRLWLAKPRRDKQAHVCSVHFIRKTTRISTSIRSGLWSSCCWSQMLWCCTKHLQLNMPVDQVATTSTATRSDVKMNHAAGECGVIHLISLHITAGIVQQANRGLYGLVRSCRTSDSLLLMHGLSPMTGQHEGRYDPQLVMCISEWVSECTTFTGPSSNQCWFSRRTVWPLLLIDSRVTVRD